MEQDKKRAGVQRGRNRFAPEQSKRVDTKKQDTAAILLVIAIVIATALYLIFSAWSGFHNRYATVIAYQDSMMSSIPTTGWVVRSETPVAAGSGMIQMQRTPGEKIGKGQTIATLYQDEKYAEHQEELADVRADLASLQFATYDESPSGTALDEQVLSSMLSVKRGSASGDYSSISDNLADYRKLVLRREFLVSADAQAAMTAAAGVLYAQMEELQGYQSGTMAIQAPASGMFTAQMDGYENILTPDSVQGLTPSELSKFSALTPDSVDNCLGKIISSTSWYYAAVLQDKDVEKLSSGSTVGIYFDSLSETLNMKIQRIGESQDGEAVVVFRSFSNLNKATGLRLESGRVVISDRTGIVVPKQSLYVDEDGQTGVYIVYGYYASFRPVKILEENEASYLVKAPSGTEDNKTLKEGDEVIIASGELYEGKVVI